jgi:hypothetical protein
MHSEKTEELKKIYLDKDTVVYVKKDVDEQKLIEKFEKRKRFLEGEDDQWIL